MIESELILYTTKLLNSTLNFSIIWFIIHFEFVETNFLYTFAHMRSLSSLVIIENSRYYTV